VYSLVRAAGAQSYRPSGTAAEYTVVPADQAVALPEQVGDEVGACLGIQGDRLVGRGRRCTPRPFRTAGRTARLPLVPGCAHRATSAPPRSPPGALERAVLLTGWS